MRAYRISGINRSTGELLTANVAAIDWIEAMQLMHITHYRLTCLDRRGVEIERCAA